jgi:methylenetetrahydrofolate reductase (NADPH)
MIVTRSGGAAPAAAGTLRSLAAAASVEATPRAARAADLRRLLPPGMRVHVPHLPGAPIEERRAACAVITAAGLRPVPHVSAREAPSAAALDDDLAALAEAGAEAFMLIGGGGAQQGPFGEAEALIESGALQRRGVRRLAFAAHPEGHPEADEATLMRSLARKLDLVRDFADEVWLVTQFVFEAAPAIAWLERLRAEGVTEPVRLGLTGPASPRTLLLYAMRCGIGPSLKALQGRPSLAGWMARRWQPDALARDLAAEVAAQPHLGVEGLHLFPFGGLDSAADWLARQSATA